MQPLSPKHGHKLIRSEKTRRDTVAHRLTNKDTIEGAVQTVEAQNPAELIPGDAEIVQGIASMTSLVLPVSLRRSFARREAINPELPEAL